jgi:hypothetical protein
MSRFVKIAGLCLASMLLVGMALAGTANAAPLWLVCLKGSGLTKYSTSSCLTASSGGEWQSEGLASGTKVTVKVVAITLHLTDTKATGSPGVVCGGAGSEGTGTIEGPNKGTITSAKYASAGTDCKGTGTCEKAVKVEGADLPWKTELAEEGGKVVTKIAADGGGEPGWKVECETLLGTKLDTCLTESASEEEQVELAGKVDAELLVLGTFQHLHKAKCTEGGAKSGEVTGSIAILLPGGALSINS